MSSLLGVYIPTMNRPAELKECLEAFIKQGRKHRLDIYVSDNSQGSQTKELVRNLSKKYRWLHYARRDPKGYADNVKSVLAMGDTKYVWLFGDDDTIKSGAIDLILSKLDAGIDYLQVNSEVYSHDLNRKIKPRIIKKSGIEFYNNDEYETALLNNGNTGYQGFMAHMIVRKSLLDRELRKLDISADNMDFVHTIIFYRAIKNRKGMLLADPLINNRGGNWSYSKRIMEIFFRSWYKTHHMLSRYYRKETLDNVMSQPLIGLIIPVAINRIVNRTSVSEEYNKYIKTNSDIPQRYRYALLLIMYMPRFAIRAVFDTYKTIKGY